MCNYPPGGGHKIKKNRNDKQMLSQIIWLLSIFPPKWRRCSKIGPILNKSCIYIPREPFLFLLVYWENHNYTYFLTEPSYSSLQTKPFLFLLTEGTFMYLQIEHTFYEINIHVLLSLRSLSCLLNWRNHFCTYSTAGPLLHLLLWENHSCTVLKTFLGPFLYLIHWENHL